MSSLLNIFTAGARARTEARDRAAEQRTGAPVVLDAVSFAYDGERGERALDASSLSIAAGELVCLVGPSGSGKSTILNLVAGLLSPTSGAITCGGAKVSGPGPERAVVFQDAALFPWLTLEENVGFPLRVADVDGEERRARVEELLRLVHLWRFRDRYPHELSGGMKQRGAIARALATDPEVLLMDEPFAALDAQTREILHGEVERIWRASRKTVIFVTHNVREAVRLGDRVVLMGTRPGRVIDSVHVDAPRPRASTDTRVIELAKTIGERIAVEVEKVAKEEADDAWIAPGSRVRADPRRAMGGGI